MKTISVRIDDETKQRLDRLTVSHGLNASHLMRQAISEKLEELEDFYTVSERMASTFKPVSNDEVWKRLGIKD